MIGGSQPAGPCLFPAEYRASGLLLHITSLPSRYGIGDLGPEAAAWIDRLADSGQSWWQALPLGPTGYYNSPYSPLSSFAANELLISPARLIEDGLLPAGSGEDRLFPVAAVDYEAVIPFKHRLVEQAWCSFCAGVRPDLKPDYEQFCHDHHNWLDDYALFRALRDRHDGAHYLEWPEELVGRVPAAIAQARQELQGQIDSVRFAQFLLFRQGEALKRRARAKGVRLIGDLPFFVAADSSDVWANPDLFLLDDRRRPKVVAGVPPDYFAADGQLWGNPVYDWDAVRRTGYRWWIQRVRTLLAHVDVVRLDHFRAFAAAWHVPADAATARVGEWVPGPGEGFFTALQSELGALPFIAEDLGLITPDVTALREQFELPGLRVLQFAFDGDPANPHLPQNYVTNTVVYTGTHDNPTTCGWFEDLPDHQRQNLWNYVRRRDGGSREAASALMSLAWSSNAALAMAPLQDLLALGKEARMNVPGLAQGNWRWRCTEDLLNSSAFRWLSDLTTSTRRSHNQPL